MQRRSLRMTWLRARISTACSTRPLHARVCWMPTHALDTHMPLQPSPLSSHDCAAPDISGDNTWTKRRHACREKTSTYTAPTRLTAHTSTLPLNFLRWLAVKPGDADGVPGVRMPPPRVLSRRSALPDGAHHYIVRPTTFRVLTCSRKVGITTDRVCSTHAPRDRTTLPTATFSHSPFRLYAETSDNTNVVAADHEDANAARGVPEHTP